MARLDRLLERGIEFVKKGQIKDARKLLKAVIDEDSHNQLAWGWYVQSFEADDERLNVLNEYLAMFPNDQKARLLRASLLDRQNKRWEQLAVDAVQELAEVKEESSQEITRLDKTLWRTRRAFIIIGFLITSILCFSTYSSAQEKAELSNQITDLEFDYSTLQIQHNALKINYENLESQHENLVGKHNTLVAEYNELSKEYNTLLGEYNWLEDIAVTPPYIITSGRDMRLAFEKLDGSIVYWDMPFRVLEDELQRGNLMRNEIDNNPWDYTLSFHNTNTDENFHVLDLRPFVGINYLSPIISNLYSQSSSDDAFIREVWNIVAQLTTYSSELEDTPRYSLETLLAGGGDCEDTAILFASMLDAAPIDWSIELVYMDMDNPTNPLTMNHVIVYIDTGDQSYLVETTSKNNMTPFEEGVSGWYYDIDGY